MCMGVGTGVVCGWACICWITMVYIRECLLCIAKCMCVCVCLRVHVNIHERVCRCVYVSDCVRMCVFTCVIVEPCL